MKLMNVREVIRNAPLGQFLGSGMAVVGVGQLLEEPAYQIVQRLGPVIEVRQYAPRRFAEYRLQGHDRQSRGRAFQSLFRFISGRNAARRKMAMTVPVAMRHLSGPGGAGAAAPETEMAMRFFLPRAMRGATTPEAENPLVTRGELPVMTLAVLPYTGSQNLDRAAARRRDLVEALSVTPWRPVGPAETYLYNPPFSIPARRRIEAAVEVRHTPGAGPLIFPRSMPLIPNRSKD